MAYLKFYLTYSLSNLKKFRRRKIPKNRPTIVIEVHQDELMVLLIEAVLRVQRPDNMTVKESLGDFKRRDPDMFDRFLSGSRVCMDYFIKQAEKNSLVQ